MKAEKAAVSEAVIFIAADEPDNHYLYRQAFGEACPTAVLYFFMHKGELLDALRSTVYPKPSLLIMDWNMADRKGYVALSTLAKSPDWQTIPVVIMASQDCSVDEAKCQALGYELVLPRATHHESLVVQLAGLAQALI